MTQRIHIVPTRPMARVLAEHHPRDRADAAVAAMILRREGYEADAIAAGLDEAMRMAGDLFTAAASDRTWARRLGYVRDTAALLTLMVGGAYAWAVLA